MHLPRLRRRHPPGARRRSRGALVAHPQHRAQGAQRTLPRRLPFREGKRREVVSDDLSEVRGLSEGADGCHARRVRTRRAAALR